MHVRVDCTNPPVGAAALAGGGILLLHVLLFAVPAFAQQEPAVIERVPYERGGTDWRDCGLRKIEEDAYVSHRLAPSKRRGVTANIEVEYGDGFTSEARAAFERAVDLWEAHIWSPVTIRIEARFQDQEDRTLGGARSNLLYAVDEDGNGQPDAVYGDALVDALLAADQNSSESGDPNPPDIVATFNSGRDDWHFGAEDAPQGTVDFTSVVVHEIAHGLGYFDIFEYEDGQGRYGHDWDDDGTVGGDEKFADVFGQRVVQEQQDGAFLFVTNRSAFGTPSTDLGDALTSDRLFFDGAASAEAARESDGPVPPKLYAPPEFEEGSSVSHLDEETYPPRTLNALMTPKISRAETIRRTGPIVCGQMADVGWTLGVACTFDDASLEILSAEPSTDDENRGRVELRWQWAGSVSVESFIIEDQYFGMDVQRDTVAADGPGEYTATVGDLNVGQHTFRLIYVKSGEVAVQGAEPVSVTVRAQRPEISVYPNPFFEEARVSFMLPERQEVTVEVYDVLGRQVATPFAGERQANDPRPVVFDANRLPDLGSGVYFFQVTGETFTQTARATHIH